MSNFTSVDYCYPWKWNAESPEYCYLAVNGKFLYKELQELCSNLSTGSQPLNVTMYNEGLVLSQNILETPIWLFQENRSDIIEDLMIHGSAMLRSSEYRCGLWYDKKRILKWTISRKCSEDFATIKSIDTPKPNLDYRNCSETFGKGKNVKTKCLYLTDEVFDNWEEASDFCKNFNSKPYKPNSKHEYKTFKRKFSEDLKNTSSGAYLGIMRYWENSKSFIQFDNGDDPPKFLYDMINTTLFTNTERDHIKCVCMESGMLIPCSCEPVATKRRRIICEKNVPHIGFWISDLLDYFDSNKKLPDIYEDTFNSWYTNICKILTMRDDGEIEITYRYCKYMSANAFCVAPKPNPVEFCNSRECYMEFESEMPHIDAEKRCSFNNASLPLLADMSELFSKRIIDEKDAEAGYWLDRLELNKTNEEIMEGSTTISRNSTLKYYSLSNFKLSDERTFNQTDFISTNVSSVNFFLCNKTNNISISSRNSLELLIKKPSLEYYDGKCDGKIPSPEQQLQFLLDNYYCWNDEGDEFGLCYTFAGIGTYEMAYDQCRKSHAEVALPKNEHENEYLMLLCREYSNYTNGGDECFIGGSLVKIFEENLWVKRDESVISWMPNGIRAQNNCLSINATDGSWRAVSCKESNIFICQRKALCWKSELVKDKCFYNVENNYGYQRLARSVCGNSHLSKLGLPKNEEENEVLRSHCQRTGSKRCFINAKASYLRKWRDGSGKKIDYHRFSDTASKNLFIHNSNRTRICATISPSDGSWHPENCEKILPFICELNMDFTVLHKTLRNDIYDDDTFSEDFHLSCPNLKETETNYLLEEVDCKIPKRKFMCKYFQNRTKVLAWIN